MNLDIVFCVKLLFTLVGLKNNIGSYLLFGIIMISVVCCIFFYAKKFKVIFSKINAIIKEKNKSKQDKKKVNIINIKTANDYDIINLDALSSEYFLFL